MNQSIHMIDLLQYLMGPVNSLSAYTATLAHSIEVEDTAAASLRFQNNALGLIYGTTASFPGQFRRLEITGTKGTVIMVENSYQVWQFVNELKEDRDVLKKFGKIERYGKGLDVDIEGSGLGLFITKRIIEAHNGSIFVESEGRNKGATFTIRLYKS